jgi:hypothetical protein
MVTSLLVLTSVVVLPLLSLLVDLALLETALTRSRLMAIAQPEPSDATTGSSVTAAHGDPSWQRPDSKEEPAAASGSTLDGPLLALGRR